MMMMVIIMVTPSDTTGQDIVIIMYRTSRENAFFPTLKKNKKVKKRKTMVTGDY
jgi:hypothetical protein